MGNGLTIDDWSNTMAGRIMVAIKYGWLFFFANNILRDFKVKVSQAGIKVTDKVTIHCLRKSWASNLANAGVPPHTLMKMGGWSNIETVLKYYIKTSDENEKKAVRILDELMNRESGEKVEVGEKGGRE